MKKILIISLVCFFYIHLANAQTGSLKVFSELKDIKIYLDEVYKGTDIILIEPLKASKYYLKITKNDVVVFGEIIEVSENEVATILVKDSKEIQDKLLAKKQKEQDIYKSKKLDVLLDVKYITETTEKTQTTSKTNSLFFPGYYSVVGASNTKQDAETKTTSVTKSVTEWFIVEGNRKITHLEFANLTNHKGLLDDYNIHLQRVKNAKVVNKRKARNSRITMFVIGSLMGAGGVAMIDPQTDFSLDGQVGKQMLFISGSVFAIMGTVMTLVSIFTPTHKYDTFGLPHFVSKLSLDDAIQYARQYNRDLKAELGLPEDFEF